MQGHLDPKINPVALRLSKAVELSLRRPVGGGSWQLYATTLDERFGRYTGLLSALEGAPRCP